MAPQPAPSPKVCFGPFEFDPAAAELRKYGIRVRLQGQPILILTMLLYNPGELVTREDLRRYLWSGNNLAEADQELDLTIDKLRQALGDRAASGNAAGDRYIETVPGSGYRFVAAVHPLRPVPPLVDVKWERPEPATEPAPAGGRKLWLGLAALAVLLAVAAAGRWWLLRPAAPAGAIRTVVTAPPGFVMESAADRQTFSLSPDGGRLAFTALDGNGNARVFWQDLSSGQPVREVAGAAGAESLFWSPDGRALCVSANGRLLRVDPVAGTSHVLADVPAGLLSGTWVAADRLLLSGWNTSLSLVQSEGTARDLGERFHWPQALPDGEHFLHSSFDAVSGRHQVRAGLIDGVASDGWDLTQADSRAQYAASATAGQGHLLFVRDGHLMAQPFDPQVMRTAGEPVVAARNVLSSRATGAAEFSVADGAPGRAPGSVAGGGAGGGVLAYRQDKLRSQLVWVDRAGKELGLASGTGVVAKMGRISPDGSRLVTALYDGARGEQDLWTIQDGVARRVSVSLAMRDEPVWSRDGKRLAYTRGSAPRAVQTFVRDFSADNESNVDQDVPARTSRETPGDWSPDGRFLLVVSTAYPRLAREQQSDVVAVDFLRDRRRRPLIESRFNESAPAFSPDGRWLAFVSDEAGQPEIYVQEFEGGDEPALLRLRQRVTQVAGGGVRALRWRSDGKELFYLGADGRVNALAVKWNGKPEFGAPVPLFTLSAEVRASGPAAWGFDVAVDGQRFLVAKASGERASLVVVRNWESLLGK